MASPIEQQTRRLVVAAGGYLRNIIRESGITCATCTTPVDGYTRCWRCNNDAAIPGLADIVVPLTYAIAHTQSGQVMRQYKDDASQQVRAAHTAVIRRLLYLGIVKHEQCIEQIVGKPVGRRFAIPSSTGRAGVHPFVTLARDMNAVDEDPQLIPRTDTSFGEREVTAARFTLSPTSIRLDGQHVMILDDTWTTGSRTQSAALLLRQHGAAHVSIMAVSRWIEPGFGDNKTFIRQRLGNDFNPDHCPVTGSTCPAPGR